MAPKPNSSLPPPSKKRKTNSRNSEKVATFSAKSIANLEKQVAEALQTNASLNPLADLVQSAVSTRILADAELCLKAVFACYRSFVLVIQKGLLDQNHGSGQNGVDGSGAEQDTDRKAVRTWLSGKLDTFVEVLCGLLRNEDKTLRTSALKILFSLLRQQSNRIGLTSDPSSSSLPTAEKPLRFDVPFFKKIVEALLVGVSSSKNKKSEDAGVLLEVDTRDQLLDSWLDVYGDVRWFFLRETTAVLNNKNLVENNTNIILNALAILEKLANFPTEKNFSDQQFWIEDLGAKPKKKKKGGKAHDKDYEESEDDNQTKNELDPNDWRAFFEEPKETDTKVRQAHQRIHTMSIHEQLHSLPAHRAVFTKCWLTLLPLLSTSSKGSERDTEEKFALITRALNILHVSVLPHLTRAILIMDWVSACVDFGGNVGLLALNALFTLMRDYNLDYPQFYTRLYTFLDRNVLHLKHRSRFFRLTELFLSSSHLPATLLASFVKRLSRLSLSASPAAIIMIIPFTYNILKRHPALMVMIHRSSDSEDDSFDPKETDPTLTNALQSSLWELYSQKRHYHSVVSTMSKIFEEAFTKPHYAMEDFLDHTYATLFDSDINRKIKKEPAVLDNLVVSNAETTEDVISLWQLS